MDGLPALDLWDVVIEVLHSSKNTHQAVKGHCRKRKRSMIKCREVEHAVKSKAPTPTPIQKRNCNREVDELSNLDYICHKRKTFSTWSQALMFEDNEAVIKMMYVSRTHRVALEWLFDRISLDLRNPNQIC